MRLCYEDVTYNRHGHIIVCLFVLRLNVKVNNFFSHVGTEPMLAGFNQYCRELMCLAQGHNMVMPVGIEPRTSRFKVQSSTTMPPRSLWPYYKENRNIVTCIVTRLNCIFFFFIYFDRNVNFLHNLVSLF